MNEAFKVLAALKAGRPVPPISTGTWRGGVEAALSADAEPELDAALRKQLHKTIATLPASHPIPARLTPMLTRPDGRYEGKGGPDRRLARRGRCA